MSNRLHPVAAKNQSRFERIRQKASLLRDKVKASTAAYFERRERRVAWWQRAFRTPTVYSNWLFATSSSMWMAMLSLLGLQSRSSTPIKSCTRWSRSSVRQMLYERLETRTLMATDLVSGNGSRKKGQSGSRKVGQLIRG